MATPLPRMLCHYLVCVYVCTIQYIRVGGSGEWGFQQDLTCQALTQYIADVPGFNARMPSRH